MAGARQEGQGEVEEDRQALVSGRFALSVGAEASGQRLDQFVAGQRRELSRAQVQRLIREGRVRVAGEAVKAGYRVRRGQRVEVEVPPPSPSHLEPEEIPLTVLYEDECLLVVDKPAGLTVHPGAGRRGGTLVNALLAHWRGFGDMGEQLRPGILHRLDKGTSGLMVVAKEEACQRRLAESLARRELERRYLALVWEVVKEPNGRVDMPIGRHPVHRQKMAPAGFRGREAVTEYVTLERFAQMSLLECRLVTGRTHQIRVHCQWMGHSVVGDRDYGGVRGREWGALPEAVQAALERLQSQALHAYRLRLAHPLDGRVMTFTSRPRDEMMAVLEALGSRVVGRLAAGSDMPE